jgi:hypothetical protein
MSFDTINIMRCRVCQNSLLEEIPFGDYFQCNDCGLLQRTPSTTENAFDLNPIQYAKEQQRQLWILRTPYLFPLLQHDDWKSPVIYALRSLKEIADMSNYTIIHVRFAGDDILLSMMPNEYNLVEDTETIQRILNEEIERGILRKELHRGRKTVWNWFKW